MKKLKLTLQRAGIYLQVLMKDWTETFHNYRPELLKKYEAQVDELIADFVEPVVTSANDIHPTIDEALKSLKENILSLRTMLKDTAGDIFEGINQAAKEAHRAVNPEVAASWQSTYQKCGAERGVGHYDRNKKVHKEHLNSDGGFLMYKRAGVTMQKMMNAALKKLPEKFEASFSNALTQLREDLRVTLDRYSVSNVETNDLPALASKGRLQKALKQNFDELEKSWGIEPEPEIQDPDRVEPVTVEDIGDSEIDDFNPQDFE
jgi:hypothetical protein